MPAGLISGAKYLVALAALLYFFSGCVSKETVTIEAARAAYKAELLKCVADSKTVEESGACRKAVKNRWGIEAVGE